jgi:hypothetical protein
MRLSRQAGVFCVCAFLVALTGCDLAYPAMEGRFDRTLSVTGHVNLEIHTGSGSIDVRPGASSTVEIHGRIQARDDWRNKAQDKISYLETHPPIEQSGNIIRIGQIDEEAYRNNVSLSYEILVPDDTEVDSQTGSGSERIHDLRGPVRATTGSGSIAMANISGNVRAHTGSGSIELDQIVGDVEAATGSGSIRAERIAGSIRAETGSGGIILELTAAERGPTRDVEARTGSGSIRASGVAGSLRADTGSGGITASGNPMGEWKLSTSSGSVMLRLDPEAAFDLDAHASSGTVSVHLPIDINGIATRHEVRGKVRGGGNLVDVRAGSGGITIQ